jgi:hypothetical protein
MCMLFHYNSNKYREELETYFRDMQKTCLCDLYICLSGISNTGLKFPLQVSLIYVDHPTSHQSFLRYDVWPFPINDLLLSNT